MKTLFILQARVNSKRLFSKSILPIYKNKSSIEIIIEKAKKSKLFDKLYVATGPIKKNKKILSIIKNKANIYFGSENNVRKRFEVIQKKENSDLVIRATGDNPLIDMELVKYLINLIKKNNQVSYLKINKDYVSPGFSAEIFKSKYFFKYLSTDQSSYAKEHVTVHMLRKKKSKIIKPPKNFFTPSIRVTLDTIDDYNFLKYIYSKINLPNIKKFNKFLKFN